MKILGKKCVLMEVINITPNIDQLKKNIKQVEMSVEYPVVLIFKNISRYRRKSLLQNRISFLVENGQMYLPFISLDLRKTHEDVEENVKKISRVGQIVFLYFLYSENTFVEMKEIAEKTNISIMNTSRALKELSNLKLLTYKIGGKTGRTKYYKRLPDPEYFVKGRDYLKTPVKKVIYSKKIPHGALLAGLDALSELSMLNPPVNKILAIDKDKLNYNQIEVVENKDLIKDLKLVEVEIWNYNPGLFTNNQYVDLLSLYASLKDDEDERVKQALEEILRGESWYTD